MYLANYLVSEELLTDNSSHKLQVAGVVHSRKHLTINYEKIVLSKFWSDVKSPNTKN